MPKQPTARSEQSQSIHEIIRNALRCAAVASTPNGAIDLLGDALTQLDKIVSDRGME
jgi:hypothetical protein